MREGVGNYLAPAKEFYGEGATGFGVSGPRGLPGDGHGGGGQQGLHHLDHEGKNKLDLKLPKQEATGIYIFSGKIGYNMKEGERYKVKNLVHQYEGRMTSQLLQLDPRLWRG